MQAFKAANPGAIFADFVRWHSPRDWLPAAGRLTARMSTPNNLWVQLWEACGALCMAKQPLLFDHRREAERIISELENIVLEDLLAWLLPAGIKCISALVNRLAINYQQPGIHLRVPDRIDADALDAFLATLHSAEHHLSLARDLCALLPRLDDTDELLRGNAVLVGQDSLRARVQHLFGGAHTIEQLELSISSLPCEADGQPTMWHSDELYIKILTRQQVQVGLVTRKS